jgi:hypothetical protein
MPKRYQRGNQNPYIKEEQTTQVVCSSLIYGFWLPLWYLLGIVLSVLLWYMDSDYLFGIFWALCCLFFFDIWILITSTDNTMDKRYQRGNQNLYIKEEQTTQCPKDTKEVIRIQLPLWYLLSIVLSVLLWYIDSDYLFGIFWALCCLFFFDNNAQKIPKR